MKTHLQHSIFLTILMSLWIIGCQKNNEPDPAITSFTVTAKVVPGMADLKPNNFVNNVNLTWTKPKVLNGDSVTYTVLYRDTLAKGLTDTTFIIHNVGNNIMATGLVIARTNKGITSSSPFNINSGIAPRVRIKKWSRSSGRLKYDNYTTYTYDSLGRLASFDSQEGKVCCYTRGQTSVLKYDQLGRLISVEGLPNGDNTGQFEIYLNTYEYDQKGNLSLVKIYYTTYQNPPLKLRREERYEYNDANLLIKATSGSPNSVYVYTYLYAYKDGNIIQVDQSDNQGNKYDSSTYQYDTSPNPFYELLSTSEFNSIVVTNSKNNITGNNVTITYDSYGLIKTRVDRSNIDKQEAFEYESY